MSLRMMETVLLRVCDDAKFEDTGRSCFARYRSATVGMSASATSEDMMQKNSARARFERNSKKKSIYYERIRLEAQVGIKLCARATQRGTIT